MITWRKGTCLVSALAFCVTVAHADPVDDQLNAVLGQLNAGDAQGAVSALDRIQNPTPTQLIRARYYRAYAHKRKGDMAGAIAEFERFLPAEKAPAQVREQFATQGGAFATKAQFVYCEALFEAGRFIDAAQAYRRFAAEHPSDPKAADASFRSSGALYQADRFLDAAEAYGDFAAKYPTHQHAMFAAFRKEESLRNALRFQDAYDYLLTMPKMNPAWEIEATVRRAQLLAQRMRRDYALSNRLLEEIIAKYPEHPGIREAWCRLGRNYLYDLPAEQRDYAKAREILQPLLARNPDWNMGLELSLDIAGSYYYEKDYETAATHLLGLLSKYPDNFPKDNWHAYARFLLGDSLYRANRVSEALAVWRETVTLYPNDCWAGLAQDRLTKAGAK